MGGEILTVIELCNYQIWPLSAPPSLWADYLYGDIHAAQIIEGVNGALYQYLSIWDL